MVRDYVADLYEPAAASADVMSLGHHDRARALAAWKQRVVDGWDDVSVGDIDSESQVIDLGRDRAVSAEVVLGSLGPDDVHVQLLHGPVGPADELTETSIVTMTLADPATKAAGAHRYTGAFTCERAGRYGFTVRVVPAHEDLKTFAELGRVAWAVHAAPGG
jgi:starch phosphorylase